MILLLVFFAGFLIAWIIRTIKLRSEIRLHKGTSGLLESERLIKETLRKENALAFQLKETAEAELGKKLKEAEALVRQMDQDIILLQKSNEETEALLNKGMPELYQLKLKLIEANNTISRLKAQLSKDS